MVATAAQALVYRHAKHLISLTAVRARQSDSGAASQSTGGILNWTNDGVTYWAVSDIPSSDLSWFARLFHVTQADQ